MRVNFFGLVLFQQKMLYLLCLFVKDNLINAKNANQAKHPFEKLRLPGGVRKYHSEYNIHEDDVAYAHVNEVVPLSDLMQAPFVFKVLIEKHQREFVDVVLQLVYFGQVVFIFLFVYIRGGHIFF